MSHFAQSRQDQRLSVIDVFLRQYGWADALREKLDAALEELKADGTMKEISMKWFGFDVTP